MTLNDFIALAVEDFYDCKIWDNEKEEEIYAGELSDIPDELSEREIASWEIDKGVIIFNI